MECGTNSKTQTTGFKKAEAALKINKNEEA
jgi:hypothetical protein